MKDVLKAIALGSIVVVATFCSIPDIEASPKSSTRPAAPDFDRGGDFKNEIVTSYLLSFHNCRRDVIQASAYKRLSFDEYWRSIMEKCEPDEVRGRILMNNFVRSEIFDKHAGLSFAEREAEITRRRLPILLEIRRRLEAEYNHASE